jgi:osmotically inducible protein OsmC
MKRNASAHWEGGLKEGKGTVSTESGGLTHDAAVPAGFGTHSYVGAAAQIPPEDPS